ncbi:Nicotinamidase-related amidase [Cupriavidus necator]|uniref:Amidase related to nicotinamidase n=1 Tax=Cupriavidus necator (strain ATCC 17699 / DSM 428 / KCTC 22496 / NCIMB 10442 / H16 / Stanier 337) TaxID=381666 RepID=Q0K318_CUPNH|nr:N-carbamoylsarcosine amidohydrolase [Cupriavidus necator]QCC03504.1 isochorismatase family protein [Cupriavidus necator H16]QQB80559.1 isochorismatase family protein [Cupriavidus necator]WKA44841.1 N-carbamoylsarcosine amidohydrolase [Cupriavidus necator]CAJ95606.1 amidase related to nicotinamidase [Cupriavidus necator H16]
MHKEIGAYQRQGFGNDLELAGPFGLLLVDFVNGFADPEVFGGGNIREAIANTVPLLAVARREGWAIAHSRIVFADDGSDHNIFSMKVPNMLSLKERERNSAIVEELAPRVGELVVRKTVPSAFFGTSLAAWLTQRGVRTLVVAGAVTSGCVRASVVDAMQYGLRPLVLSDCVGDRALGPHQANLFDMEQKYATVTTRAEGLAAIGVRE